MWPCDHNPNAIPLHTYKPEAGYWREGRQWTYSSTKIGGHQFDHLRLAGKDYHGNQVDLWESHPRRRFGGLPVSFWMGIEEAKGQLDQPPSSSMAANTQQQTPTNWSPLVPPRGGWAATLKDSEEFSMYRRYLASIYGPTLGCPTQPSSPPPADEVMVVTPHGPSAHPRALSPLPPPPTETERIWRMYKEEGGRRRTLAAGSAVAAVSGLYYKYHTGRKGDEEDKAEVDMADGAGLEAKLVHGHFGEGVTTVKTWNARISQTPRWSQLRRYEFQQSLGKGAHSEAFLVEKGGQKYVLKESELLQEAVNEARLLCQISSPHVVKMEDFFIETLGHRHVAYLQLEYCDGGDLSIMIRTGWKPTHRKFRLDDKIIRNTLAQIAEGLSALHDKLIIHRDLKPENILLTTTGCIKIADLGVSTRLSASIPNTTYAAGSVPFMAPEVRRFLLGEDVVYNEKADVWAVGALAYSMCMCNVSPNIANVPPSNVVMEVRRHRGWAFPANEPAEQVCLVMSRSLEMDPALRPTAKEICYMLLPQQLTATTMMDKKDHHQGGSTKPLLAKL